MSYENKSIFELNPAEKIEYAKNKLKLSIDENDKMMISYWQELLISLLTRVPKPAQELKEQVDFQNDHNIMNIKNDTSNTNADNNLVALKSQSENYEPPFFKDKRKKESLENLEKSKRENKMDNANFWTGVLEELQTKSYEYPFESQIERLYMRKIQALANGQEEVATNYHKNMVDTLNQHPIIITPDIWEQLDTTGQMHYMSLKSFEARIKSMKTEEIYWNEMFQRLSQGEQINL